MNYLLDTNIISHMIRYPTGTALARFETTDPGTAVTSIIVAAELRFGYVKAGSQRLAADVEATLTSVGVLDWTLPCDRIYAEIRGDLHRRGALIGPMDMLIAAHALALDATLVTDNEDEFRRVAGLKIENWVR
ncbi:tRNA(fMet)-specific endonuclease VapC [Pleomorphomonas sp. SM30]|uniref:Ribonuclease VapC n=2 Tax=Oharaeibacter diazotrophicus TaxID=1920512 RepID=A0A4R6RF97_9HYPH|nr:type II toxin-antitoxin system VapC family toxin [Oharaeibacter diazotrophicus]TDP84920.1 tRNA(fMet)-specific endonuclease VapC [Oharaeibacter diazotrophicus]BBE73891.1 tRNA(fMet)-specific endonuclease VapC [Pleomorphomonas sp. SM30]GLS76424.1 ribonuclease VapC [Oharaeibacter diazotrophicus]